MPVTSSSEVSPGQVAEEHQRLVERGADVIRPVPPLMNFRVRAEHVVIGQQVGVPQLLDRLSVGTDRARIGADLCLREHHAYVHGSLSIPPTPALTSHPTG